MTRGHDRGTRGHYVQVLASAHMGGAERIAFDLQRHLQRERGWATTLCVPAGGAALAYARDAQIASLGFQMSSILAGNRLSAGLANLSILARLPRDIQVVHYHSPTVFGAFALTRRLSTAPTVLHLHLNYKVPELAWALKTTPDLIVTCGRSVLPAVETALSDRPRVRAPRIRAVPNPVDTSRFAPPVERAPIKIALGFDPEVPLALVVANLAPHKGQDTAIRATSILRHAGLPIRLALVGEERGHAGVLAGLRALVTELSVSDCVTFLGFRQDIPDLLRAADFLLLPSLAEAMPLSILEAQASKTLVIAAPTADIPDLVADGRTGYLVSARDEAGYADRIRRCLADPSMANAVTDAAYAQVLQRHRPADYWGAIVAEYEALRAPRSGAYPESRD